MTNLEKLINSLKEEDIFTEETYVHSLPLIIKRITNSLNSDKVLINEDLVKEILELYHEDIRTMLFDFKDNVYIPGFGFFYIRKERGKGWRINFEEAYSERTKEVDQRLSDFFEKHNNKG